MSSWWRGFGLEAHIEARRWCPWFRDLSPWPWEQCSSRFGLESKTWALLFYENYDRIKFVTWQKLPTLQTCNFSGSPPWQRESSPWPCVLWPWLEVCWFATMSSAVTNHLKKCLYSNRFAVRQVGLQNFHFVGFVSKCRFQLFASAQTQLQLILRTQQCTAWNNPADWSAEICRTSAAHNNN